MHRQSGAMRSALAVGLLVALAVSSAAATTAADAFLLLPVSARETALGQSMVASTDDATAFHWNPAGLAHVESIDAGASYTRLYGSLANHVPSARGGSACCAAPNPTAAAGMPYTAELA